MRRMMLYSRLGAPLGELAEADVFEAVLREEINGEHSLEITTTQVLDKGIRLLYQDGRGKWREFVVAGVDAEHASGNRAIGTYYCVWSLQQDLQGVTVSVMPGVGSPVPAATALDSLLSTQSRWTRGTVTNTNTGGASMYDRSAWEALSTLVDVWGGEVDATITVGTQSGVTGRAVDLYSEQGGQTATRRFDFGADLTGVKRTLSDNPLYCRISPRGKGEQTDAGGYGRKITIESVNGGVDWLEYAPMVDAAKLPDGNGGYEYPTLIVENGECETPADLKAWGQSVLVQYCTPEVAYDIDVVQTGIEGVDVTGVSLGDAVQVVDRKFGGDGVRVQGRVRSIVTDLLNERDVKITIGDAVESVAAKFADVGKSLAAVSNDLTTMSTAEYIDSLLQRINTEINATGGYVYITEGQGIRTYDAAVTDPLVGSEASKVVEIKGGSVRIADSKTAQGEWEWKTVFTSGHIAADLVTAAAITSGYIGNASNGAYWDLDSANFKMTKPVSYGIETLTLGDFPGLTLTKYKRLTNILAASSIPSSFYGLSLSVDSTQYADNHFFIAPEATGSDSYIGGNGTLHLTAGVSSSYNWTTSVHLESYGVVLCNPLDSHTGNNDPIATFGRSSVSINKPTEFHNEIEVLKTNDSTVTNFGVSDSGVVLRPPITSYGRLTAYNGIVVSSGGLSVTGTKNRRVSTPDYNDRLLYCYETPSPMFGDVGSGTIGEDGLCYVEVDGIFGETARTDLAYQVFLQACGEGSLYVAEKHMTYFVVAGTPGLAFDWELKARQTGFECLRIEDAEFADGWDEYGDGVDESVYAEELDYIGRIERALNDEAA